MMTAGLRKKAMSDIVHRIWEKMYAVLFLLQEKYFTWLPDGVSDDDSWKDPATKKEYFSSRLLAQSIGYRLRNSFYCQQARPTCNYGREGHQPGKARLVANNKAYIF
jgi:hypothetical protein